MNYEWFISLRHLRSRKTHNFISLITAISIGGVALGVMALIIVIAVMSGFGKDLRDKIIGTTSHIVVTAFNQSGMNGYESVIRDVKKVEGVMDAAPFIFSQVMLIKGDKVSGVVIRGIDPRREINISDLDKNLIAGDLNLLEGGAFSWSSSACAGTPPISINEFLKVQRRKGLDKSIVSCFFSPSSSNEYLKVREPNIFWPM